MEGVKRTNPKRVVYIVVPKNNLLGNPVILNSFQDLFRKFLLGVTITPETIKLSGRSESVMKRLQVIDRDQCIGCFSCMFACSRSFYKALTTEKSAMRVRVYPGLEGAFSIRVCDACLEPDCASVCPTGALIKREKGGGVKLIEDKCIHCQKCIKACLIASLQWDREKKIPIPCRHCGICVQYCPNHVIGMVDMKEEEAVSHV